MSRQTSGAFLLKYLGIPYEDFDCYELIKLFYEKEFGVEIIDLQYQDPSERKLGQMTEISQLVETVKEDYFKKVTEPKFGDIILLRIWGMPAHVGIYIGKGRFLHTSKTTGSCVEKLSKWQNKILGYYEYDKA